MILHILWFAIAIVVLNKSADWFARSAGDGRRTHGALPRLWMGAVLGGFVSAIPEKLFSCFGSAFGHSQLAVGNSIGSVTFNCVLLGICLLQARGPIEAEVVSRPRHSHAGFAAHPLRVRDAEFDPAGRSVCCSFCCALSTVVWSIIAAERQPGAGPAGGGGSRRRRWAGGPSSIGGSVTSFLLAVSITRVLLLSSYAVYRLSLVLAQDLGLGEAVVALTLVAVGTSLPRNWRRSLAATRRGTWTHRSA